MRGLKIERSRYTEKEVTESLSIRYPEKTGKNYTLELYSMFLEDSGYGENNLKVTRNGIRLKIKKIGLDYEILGIETDKSGKVHTLSAKSVPHIDELQRFQSLIETGEDLKVY